jgi:hypothetical protein
MGFKSWEKGWVTAAATIATEPQLLKNFYFWKYFCICSHEKQKEMRAS